MTRVAAGVLVALAAILGCSEQLEDPYRVDVDLGPAIRALGDEDVFESDAGRDLLAALGADALPALLVALEREPATTRAMVVELLAGLEDPPLERLVAAARDADPGVRASVVGALAATADDARATAVVEAALDDPAAEVRAAAAGACARACRAPEALEGLVRLALDPKDLVVAERARGALRQLLERDAEDARKAIERVAPHALATTGTMASRLRAALLLAEAGDRRAIEPLSEAARAPSLLPILRVHAIAALGSLPDPASVAALADLIDVDPRALGRAACVALARLTDVKIEGAANASARCPDGG